MKSNVSDREFDKFRDDNGLSKVAVSSVDPIELTNTQFTGLNQESTQLEVKAQLVAANTSLDNLELITDAIRLRLIEIELDTNELIQIANNTYNRLNTFSLNAGLSDANTLRTASNVYGIDSDGVIHQIRTNKHGEPIIHGVYDNTQNTKPSSVGLIAHERQNNPTDNHQTRKLTSVQSGIRTALDVSVLDEDGNPFTVDNRLPVTSIDYLQETLITGAKTVNSTQVRASVGANNLSGRKSLIIYNAGTVNVYYGASGVTVASGVHIAPQAYATFDVFETVDIFLIAGSATEVRISEAK